jgi:hypothetical protein
MEVLALPMRKTSTCVTLPVGGGEFPQGYDGAGQEGGSKGQIGYFRRNYLSLPVPHKADPDELNERCGPWNAYCTIVADMCRLPLKSQSRSDAWAGSHGDWSDAGGAERRF